ncbi:MAG TPA: efflux RND transporter permease subunit, partial [Planctomycetota bacterium]|nr:efflux RND transporter permease subunit [Planctomycetota bacterium]
RTELGPDATSVGWVYQYALVDDTGRLNLADLRSLQDWYLRYQLQSVPGVAEVASVGGFVRQYQVQVLPNALHAYRLELSDVVKAIRQSNGEIGGGLLEFSGTEFMVRAKGYFGSVHDIEQIALGRNPQTGGPLLVKDVALVRQGPELRRGVADLDGRGDAVGGIVVMRYGDDVLPVVERVKARLAQIRGSLPPGVRVVATYDRSDLIRSVMATLQRALGEELVIVSLVILIFLWHLPSALVPILTIPAAVLLAYIPMLLMGASSNLMSLSGIAISIGVLVDGAIIEVENACKKLELWTEGGRKGDFNEVRLAALKEVGPSVFFSLLVIAAAFLPVFALSEEEGRLFRPLAYTKTLAMVVSAVLAVTFNPALRMALARVDPFRFKPAWASWLATEVFVGRYHKEESHPVSRRLFRFYQPVCQWALAHPGITLLAAGCLLATAAPAFMSLGSEFMPPLNEGSILYMPTALPGVSITEAQRVLQLQDRILRSFPEVESVFGKAGRADTPTDPAPLSMFETTVILKPRWQWRRRERWYSSWAPRPFKVVLGRLWPETISYDELVGRMDDELKFPGFPNIWSHPIRARNDMLSTGMRAPVGIKVFGPDLKEIEKLAGEVERVVGAVRGTRNVFAERVAAGSFVDFTIRRDQLARYGLTLADVQDVIMTAVGGANVATAIEGRERYSVQVRYARDFRDDLDKLKNIRVGVPADSQIPGSPGVPLAELAEIRKASGPAMIRDENGLLAGYVYVDVAGRDVGGYVEEAKRVVRDQIQLPTGYAISWSGQYEAMERVKQRLIVILPLTSFLILLLLYLNTKSFAKTLIIMLAVPFSAVGAIWFLYALGYNMSIGVWVGLIALMGVDAETGVFMLLYLDLAYEKARMEGIYSLKDLRNAIRQGAVKRIRPKFMTVACMFLGLVPILWSTGTGADVMKRIAAPMVGGILTSFLLELMVYPAIYEVWKWNFEVKKQIAAR